jgi:hypothetical protein
VYVQPPGYFASATNQKEIMILTTAQLLQLAGLRNAKTVYSHISKGNLIGSKRSRNDGGLGEWVFKHDEALRFVEWIKSTPARRR